jgi:hypothetical protein
VGESTNLDSEPDFSYVFDRLEERLEELGMTHNSKFERHVKQILDGLDSNSSDAFELAQVQMGRLLGYEADNSSEEGSPDPWWVLNEHEGIVFEDYTDCEAHSVISIVKVRQAASHPNWLRQKGKYPDVNFYPVFLSQISVLGVETRIQCNDIAYWNRENFVRWAKEAISVLREIRKSYPGQGDLVWRGMAMESYISGKIDPKGVLATARSVELRSLPDVTKKDK